MTSVMDSHDRRRLISKSQMHGVHVLRLHRQQGPELLALLRAAFDELDGEPVIVDVSNAMLSSAQLVRDIVALTANEPDGLCCFVSGRGTARAVLQSVGQCRLPVFTTVADAVQARKLHGDGYGPGWSALPAVPASSPHHTKPVSG